MAHMLLSVATRDFSGKREVFTFWWRLNRSYLCGRQLYFPLGATQFFWQWLLILCTALYSFFVVLLTYKDVWQSCARSSFPILRFHVLIDRSGLLETPGKCSSFVVEQLMNVMIGRSNACDVTRKWPLSMRWYWESAVKNLVRRFQLWFVALRAWKEVRTTYKNFGKYNRCKNVITTSGHSKLEALYTGLTTSVEWTHSYIIALVCVLTSRQQLCVLETVFFEFCQSSVNCYM